MPIIYGSNKKKKAKPYSLEQLSKDINSGRVKTQEELNAKIYKQGYESDVSGSIAPGTSKYAPQAAVSQSSGSEGQVNLPNKPTIGPVARERKQPVMLSSQDGRRKIQQQEETLADLSAQPDAYGLTDNGQIQTDSAGNQIYGSANGKNIITGAPQQPKKSEDQQLKGVKMINPETEQIANDVNPNDVPNLQQKGYQVAEASGDALVASTPEIAALRRANQEIERETNAMIEQIRQFTLTTDSDLRAQVRSIENGYTTRANEMMESNRRREQAMQTLGVRIGSRWTGGMGGVFGGIIAAEERQGVMRLAELEQQKNDAILEAKTAAREQNWLQYSKSVDLAKEAQKNKIENIKKIGEMQAAENKRIQEEKRSFDTQIAIAGAIKEGITDPVEMFNRINFDEKGNKKGNVSLKDIGDAVKLLVKEEPSMMDQLDLTMKQLNIQKLMKELTQAPGIDSKIQAKVDALAKGFDSSDIVKRFTTIQANKRFAESLSNNTQNPADDQALIYTLAKVLDPESVVREGEYATAKKYVQSWVAAYGAEVNQAIDGTGFLSVQARKNIKATIDGKYRSSKVDYDNLKSEVSRKINDKIGAEDGVEFLTDYAIEESTKAYDSLESYVQDNPDMLGNIEQLINDNPALSDEDIMQILNSTDDSGPVSVTIPQTSRIAYTHNNPGNLKFAGQRGAIRGENGFALFYNAWDGYVALKNQIQLDASRDLSLKQFVYKYAPASENDSDTYLKQIAKWTGLNPNDPIDKVSTEKLAKAIIKKESSATIG